MRTFATWRGAFSSPPFKFLEPGVLADGEVRLSLRETLPPIGNRPAAYRFEIRRVRDNAIVGRIELRIGDTHDLIYYTGHIGYRIDPAERGHRYGAKSCLLLIPFYFRHGPSELWITCDPDNIASRRTCELAGGIFEEIVPLPKRHVFYKAGSREKCRFRVPQPSAASALPRPAGG